MIRSRRLWSMLGMSLACALSAAAQSPPHWAGERAQIDCTSQCHVPHHAAGGTLSLFASNANLCQSCHNPTGVAKGFPVSNADKAVPGQTGTSHAFEVDAVNAAAGATTPSNTAMQKRVLSGKIVCSTCHNQHTIDPALGGTPRIGNASQVTVLGSTGTVTSGGTFTGADGVWYLLDITQAGTESTARFRYSKDGGTSWFAVRDAGIDVLLDSGVTVSFGAGNYSVGERWEFSAAWPFLRASAVDSALCRDCHSAWDMTHTDVQTWTGAPRSHPVGVGLNANNGGYDRSVPLDGNGAAQGGGGVDGNASNDLVLAGGNVQCLTCHGVHHTDGNTQTVDGP